MEAKQLLDLLQLILVIVIGGLSIYFKHSEKAQRKAKELNEVMVEILKNAVIFIKEAEESYKDVSNMGGKKFEEVVNRLYDLVPDLLKGIITRKMIEEIVQSTFDEIESYVATQLDNKIETK